MLFRPASPLHGSASPRPRWQGVTEYLVIVFLVAVGTIGVVGLFGDNLRQLFGGSAEAVAGEESAGNDGSAPADDVLQWSMKGGKGAGGKGIVGNTVAVKAPEPVVAGGDAGSPALSHLTSQISTWLGRKPSRRTQFLADQIDDAHAHKQLPNALEVMAGSIDIMQDRITRSRLAGEPPDVLIAPRLAHIGILEFDRAAEAVEIGHAAASMLRPSIELALRRA